MSTCGSRYRFHETVTNCASAAAEMSIASSAEAPSTTSAPPAPPAGPSGASAGVASTATSRATTLESPVPGSVATRSISSPGRSSDAMPASGRRTGRTVWPGCAAASAGPRQSALTRAVLSGYDVPEADQTHAPRPEEEIADLLRAEPDVADHTEHPER